MKKFLPLLFSVLIIACSSSSSDSKTATMGILDVIVDTVEYNISGMRYVVFLTDRSAVEVKNITLDSLLVLRLKHKPVDLYRLDTKIIDTETIKYNQK